MDSTSSCLKMTLKVLERGLWTNWVPSKTSTMKIEKNIQSYSTRIFSLRNTSSVTKLWWTSCSEKTVRTLNYLGSSLTKKVTTTSIWMILTISCTNMATINRKALMIPVAAFTETWLRKPLAQFLTNAQICHLLEAEVHYRLWSWRRLSK